MGFSGVADAANFQRNKLKRDRDLYLNGTDFPYDTGLTIYKEGGKVKCWELTVLYSHMVRNNRSTYDIFDEKDKTYITMTQAQVKKLYESMEDAGIYAADEYRTKMQAIDSAVGSNATVEEVLNTGWVNPTLS